MEDPQCTAGSFAQCKTILCNALSTLDFAKCIFFKLDNEQFQFGAKCSHWSSIHSTLYIEHDQPQFLAARQRVNYTQS